MGTLKLTKTTPRVERLRANAGENDKLASQINDTKRYMYVLDGGSCASGSPFFLYYRA